MRQSFAKTMASLSELQGMLSAFSEKHGLSGNMITRLELSIEELFTNMVKYSKGEGTSVDLELKYSDGVVHITLSEENVDRFDPFQSRSEWESENLSSGGRGLHMVRDIVANSAYRYENRVGIISFDIIPGDSHV